MWLQLSEVGQVGPWRRGGWGGGRREPGSVDLVCEDFINSK